MLTHPFIRQPASPLTHAAPAAHAGGMPMRQPNPMAQQRTEVALGLAKQHALAQALRGGTPSGVPSPPANPGIIRPQGLPGIR